MRAGRVVEPHDSGTCSITPTRYTAEIDRGNRAAARSDWDPLPTTPKGETQ